MTHNELIHSAAYMRGPTNTDRTVCALYGVRIRSDSDRELLEEDPGFCLNNGQVGVFWRGGTMTFLAVSWTQTEYVYHSGEYPNAPKIERDGWNSDLRAMADRLGVDIVEGPGWFTIPSED